MHSPLFVGLDCYPFQPNAGVDSIPSSLKVIVVHILEGVSIRSLIQHLFYHFLHL